jgi:hypothetical protein
VIPSERVSDYTKLLLKKEKEDCEEKIKLFGRKRKSDGRSTAALTSWRKERHKKEEKKKWCGKLRS